jgi:hypothetical protein
MLWPTNRMMTAETAQKLIDALWNIVSATDSKMADGDYSRSVASNALAIISNEAAQAHYAPLNAVDLSKHDMTIDWARAATEPGVSNHGMTFGPFNTKPPYDGKLKPYPLENVPLLAEAVDKLVKRVEFLESDNALSKQAIQAFDQFKTASMEVTQQTYQEIGGVMNRVEKNERDIEMLESMQMGLKPDWAKQAAEFCKPAGDPRYAVISNEGLDAND